LQLINKNFLGSARTARRALHPCTSKSRKLLRST